MPVLYGILKKSTNNHSLIKYKIFITSMWAILRILILHLLLIHNITFYTKIQEYVIFTSSTSNKNICLLQQSQQHKDYYS